MSRRYVKTRAKAPPGSIPAWFVATLATETDDCILWPFAKLKNGYGQFGTNQGGSRRAHREACRMAHGEPPTAEHEAAHSCGRRLCCNKRHLSWKTPVQNKADELIHGTRNRGERNGHAKLSAADVIAIRASGAPAELLASSYGVNQATVRDAQTGRTWAWL